MSCAAVLYIISRSTYSFILIFYRKAGLHERFFTNQNLDSRHFSFEFRGTITKGAPAVGRWLVTVSKSPPTVGQFGTSSNSNDSIVAWNVPFIGWLISRGCLHARLIYRDTVCRRADRQIVQLITRVNLNTFYACHTLAPKHPPMHRAFCNVHN